MNDEKVIKCIVELDRIFFPKNVSHIKSGEFGIFVADIIESLDNCENIYKSIKLKGKCCEINHGEKYKVSCKLADVNEQYGNTYEIIYINRLVDLKDKVKQRNFLMSILNETTVNRLYEEYDDVIGLLENADSTSLSKVKGVGVKSALRLIENYNSCKDYSEVYTELGHLGLTSNLIKRLVDFYKSPDVVIDVIKTNPYELVNVDGIGFKKADAIAEKLGIKGSNPNRVKGGMLHILSQNGEVGRSYLHYSDLLKQLYDNIGFIEESIINTVAESLIKNKEVHLSENGEFIGLVKYNTLENNIHNELIRINNAECCIKFGNIDNIIKRSEEEQGFSFTDEQKNAIVLFSKSNILALTGGAGVGKTSVSKGMMDLVERYTISATALSGKASVRITEATGIEASTIHRLLGFQHGDFTYTKTNQLETDVVFIDEATMINGELFLSLLEAIPSGAKLVMMGDVQQLTPIGSCQVFADVLNSNSITSIKLNKPHRQALKSGIIPLSIDIINQKQIFDSTFEGNIILGELKDMELDIYKSNNQQTYRVVNHFMKYYERTNNLMETQIIVPMKNRGDFSTYIINLEVQKKINPINPNRKNITISLDKERFYTIQVGDKVINTKNNYNAKTVNGDDVAVFNGNMGLVKEIDNGYVTVDFVGIGEVILEGNGISALELGYAITIHKSQGSGFNVVIGAIDSSAFVLLNSELLYTLVTRAKKYCVLIGKNNAIRTAINKREIKNKQTYLKNFIK